MAWADTALVQTIAPANGTNNYVLADPASQGPLRTDLQAEADGSLANGDLVHYMVRRVTTTGDAEFERGYGAWTKSTRVLARTAGNVLDSDGGPGVLKDWGLSGQMDVYFLPPLDGSDIPSAVHADFATNLGLPRLSTQNIFTDRAQVISNASDVLMVLRRTASSGAIGDLRYQAHNDAAALTYYARIRATIASNAAAAENGELHFFVTDGGAETAHLFLRSGGSLEDASGNKYDAFPSGTQLTCHSTIPVGWSRVNVAGERVVKLAESGDTVGGTGGSWTVSGLSTTVGTTAPTTTELTNHSHGVSYKAVEVQSGTGVTVDEVSTAAESPTGLKSSNDVGGGTGHSHSATTSSNGSWRPAYRIACIIEKDA